MTNKNVVIIFPNQDYAAFAEMSAHGIQFPTVHPRPFPMISLGMLYIVSAIRDIANVTYIDNNIQKLSEDKLIEFILSQKPDIVGLGGTLSEWPQASNVARRLPNDIITVYGGPNASANPTKHVKYFDYVFRGWADETFRQFVLNDPRETIAGLCWDGHIVPSCSITNITSSEAQRRPSRDVIDISRYKRRQFGLEAVDVVLHGAGCPFSCRFCSSQAIFNRAYKMRPVEDVIDEIRYMQAVYGTKVVHFREDNLTVNKRQFEYLCRELKKLHDSNGLTWICQSRVDSLDRDMIRMMKAAGCEVVCIGFESINDDTLQYIDKGFHAEDVVRTIELLVQEKMRFSGGFMVGLLNETESHIKNTLEFTRKVSQLPYSYVPRGAGRFVGWPVSEMYHEIIDNDLVYYNWCDGEELIPNTYALTAPQVEEIIIKNW